MKQFPTRGTHNLERNVLALIARASSPQRVELRGGGRGNGLGVGVLSVLCTIAGFFVSSLCTGSLPFSKHVADTIPKHMIWIIYTGTIVRTFDFAGSENNIILYISLDI